MPLTIATMPYNQRLIDSPVLSLLLTGTLVLVGNAQALSWQKRSPQQAIPDSEKQLILQLTETQLSLANSIKQTQKPQLIEAEQLEQQANQLDGAGQTQAAIPLWLRSLALYRELDNRVGETRTLGFLGIAYHALSDYPNAVQYLEAFLPLARERRARDAEAYGLSYLGNSYLSLNQYSQAVETFTAALPVLQEVRNASLESFVHAGLGNAYDNLGRYALALESYQTALTQAQQQRSPQSQEIVLVSLVGLGTTYDNLGNYDRATEFHQQGLRMAQASRNSQFEGRALNGLGNVYFSLEDYNTAKNYVQQAVAIAKRISDREGESNALGNLGNIELYLGNDQEAIAAYEQSLAIDRARNSRQGILETLSNLGIAYEGVNFNRTLELYQQALALAQQINSPLSEGIARNNLGGSLFRAGRLTEAETQLRAAVRLWEDLRQDLSDADRISLFEAQQKAYALLQEVLVQQNKPEIALEAAEQGRAQAFVALLSQRLADSRSAGRISPLTVADIQQIARQRKATLVEYSVIPQPRGRADLLIWVVQPTGTITFRKQAIETSLKDLITTARVSVGVRGLVSIRLRPDLQAGGDSDRLQQLHRLLIQPIADQLPSDPTAPVIFVPHRELFLVPFAALPNENGTPLLERHTILTAPAIQVLNLTQQQRLRTRQANLQEVLLVGNPTMPQVAPAPGEPPQTLNPLPGAQREAEAIASLFHTQPLTGSQASKTTVLRRLPNARIIHLATHGLLNDAQPLESAIALAPDATNNGLLTAAELLQLNLGAELAVLSACDTGQGRITGDGVIGLSRSLITAGVPSIIVSLWAVPDAPTAELMTEFYRQLQRSPNKAQALRQAMLTIKNDPRYANPRNWAAFTLIGEAE